ncbi:MAG TPA: sigma 54-interacting transcriptional regulator [Polyangia bacterium]|nr:sigma 54-interacting transcriptional regulator [Polyangia bacterium]
MAEVAGSFARDGSADLLDGWRRLLERLVSSADRATAVDDCLDGLMDVLDADRGLVLVMDADGVPFALNARGYNRALTPSEREEVSASIIERALAELRCVMWDNSESHLGGSMMRWGILTALAAPLMAPPTSAGAGPRRPIGALYVDFRAGHKAISATHVAIFELATALVSAVLQQTRRLQIVGEQVRRFESDVALAGGARARPGLDEIIAGHGLAGVRDEVLSVVRGRSPVLILGESGTGKTLLAEAMAEARGRGPIIRATLGTSDDLNTISSELFGHEKGAFSGALARRTGLVELADEGTLIFDELLNLPTPGQKLLLDFTQFGTFRPLGWNKREPKRANVRLIACTNGDVDAARREGRLRDDLYFRLAGARIHLPPLRDRRADIPRLVTGFLAREAGVGQSWTVDAEFLGVLASSRLSWPGNVRQLESVVQRAMERAAVETGGGALRLAASHIAPADVEHMDLGAPLPARPTPSAPLRSEPSAVTEDLLRSWQALGERRVELEEDERRLIREALARVHGVVAHAARELGTSRTGLYSRMQTLGISRVVAAGAASSDEIDGGNVV